MGCRPLLSAGIRIVSNAGGVNPLACAGAIQEVIKKAGVDLKVAVVTGDDLMPHVRPYSIAFFKINIIIPFILSSVNVLFGLLSSSSVESQPV